MLKLEALPLLLSASLVLAIQLFSLLTVPYFAGIHETEFDTSIWGNWFRLFTYLLSTLTSVLGLTVYFLSPHRFLSLCTLLSLAVCVLMTVFNVMFGLRVPALVLCLHSLHSVCMETSSTCVTPSKVATWQAFLFSWALCGLICVQSASIAVIYRKLTSKTHLINPTSVQVLTDISTRGIEVSTIIVDTQKAQKTVESKALIHPSYVRKPEKAVMEKPVSFQKTEKSSDLLSFKDFETSSNVTNPPARKRGGHRGKK